MKRIAWPRWLQPAADSVIAEEQRCGRAPWTSFVHLIWSAWVFLTPLMAGGDYGFTLRWVVLTLLSYPLFVWLFTMTLVASPRRAQASALGMVALSLVLLPWYPSGLSYFVFGCVMLRPGRRRPALAYVGMLALLNTILIVYATWLGYPWQALVWMPTVSAIVGVIVMVDRLDRRRQVALRLSQEEVRRLAATAERERIGRDLHDLLGHTLSLVALKADLAGRLLQRDPQAAQREIDELGQVAREALGQVRRAVTGIRAARLAAELAAAKVLLEGDGVSLQAKMNEPDLSPEQETVLALCLREAVTNIHRHARANHVRVALHRDGANWRMQVDDDGRGGAIRPGNGLEGMRERLQTLGGSLHLESIAPHGTRLQAELPHWQPQTAVALQP